MKGGVDEYQQWVYTSKQDMTKAWAQVQGCELDSYQRIKTPYDKVTDEKKVKGYNLTCFEYERGCAGRVVNCHYFGIHADYYEYFTEYDANLTYWLFVDDGDMD